MKKLFLLCFITITIFFNSCNFFSNPQAESQIIQTYTSDSGEYHYLHTVIKISNTGNKTIYQTTLSLQADTNIRTYYKTTTSNLTIQPNNSIFITVDFNFTDEEKTEETNADNKQSSEEPTPNNEAEDEASNKDTQEKVSEKWIEDSVKITNEFWD